MVGFGAIGDSTGDGSDAFIRTSIDGTISTWTDGTNHGNALGLIEEQELAMMIELEAPRGAKRGGQGRATVSGPRRLTITCDCCYAAIGREPSNGVVQEIREIEIPASIDGNSLAVINHGAGRRCVVSRQDP
jgi:hypothetical protein